MREDYTSYLLKPNFNVNAQPCIVSQSNMKQSFMNSHRNILYKILMFEVTKKKKDFNVLIYLASLKNKEYRVKRVTNNEIFAYCLH